ncbi:MAG: hypothetical protein ACOH16_14525 [Propionibacteriaceae bacterium]
MKRTIRVILASVGAAAVVTGGALGVAYATTPTQTPAKTSPSPEHPAATQLSVTPSATTTGTPEAAESSATVEAQAEDSTEATKAPTARPSASGTYKPHDDDSTYIDDDDADDSDHDGDEGDHHGASASASTTSVATPSPDRPHATRR